MSVFLDSRSLCAHPFLEIYDNKKNEILFFGPLVRQHDFYVPEVLEDDEDNNGVSSFYCTYNIWVTDLVMTCTMLL